MNKTKYYSGMQPALEDLEFEQISKEDAIRGRIADFFTDGVLTGLKVAIVHQAIYVEPGIGYIHGERIFVGETSLVSDTVQDGFVVIRFVQMESNPESHFITGEVFNTRVTDSFEALLLNTNNPPGNGFILAEIQSGFVIDQRPFMELKLSKPENVVAPSNLVVTTGFESDVSYTTNPIS